MTFSLEQIQHWIQDAMQSGDGQFNAQADQIFRSRNNFSAAEGLAVYQRSYLLRILSCMREQFPALCHALGQNLFDDFVEQYVRDYPPVSHTLYDLGRRFPQYLEETRPDRDAQSENREIWIDFMVDLARFEQSLFKMFDAPGSEDTILASPDTPDQTLRLQRAFSLGQYRFEVAHYYHGVKAGEAPELPDQRASYIALVRKDYLTHTIPLSETQHLFLTVMQENGSIEDGLKAVAEATHNPLDAVRAHWKGPDSVRHRWINAGFFVAQTAYG